MSGVTAAPVGRTIIPHHEIVAADKEKLMGEVWLESGSGDRSGDSRNGAKKETRR